MQTIDDMQHWELKGLNNSSKIHDLDLHLDNNF